MIDKEKRIPENISSLKDYGKGMHIFYKTIFIVVAAIVSLLGFLIFLIKM